MLMLDMLGVSLYTLCHTTVSVEYRQLTLGLLRPGKDRFHPVSKTGSQMSPKGLGWIIVDSLDTLMIMNQTARLSDARKWLQRGLTYNQNQEVNTFEMTIRMLGGLLSAHYLSTILPDVSSRRDYVYLAKAVDLADRLLGAYESKSGIPYASVNLGTRQGLPSHADGGASSTAEAATLQLEMKYLAHLTGNRTYWQKAERIMEIIDDQQMQDGLVPIFIHPDTGQFRCREIRLGSRGDSYYGLYTLRPMLTTIRDTWLTGSRIPNQTIPANIWAGANLPRDVGTSLGWDPETSCGFYQTLEAPVHCRAPAGNWWASIPEDGPSRLFLTRLNCPWRYRGTNRKGSPTDAWMECPEETANAAGAGTY